VEDCAQVSEKYGLCQARCPAERTDEEGKGFCTVGRGSAGRPAERKSTSLTYESETKSYSNKEHAVKYDCCRRFYSATYVGIVPQARLFLQNSYWRYFPL